MNKRDIFIEALDRTDPAERAAYLDQACAGDETLRQRVEELLEAHAGVSELLKGPVPAAVSTAEATGDGPAPAGETKMLSTDEQSTLDGLSGVAGLAQFEVLAELGRGGMGVVYKARHRTLNRIVALKMIVQGKHAFSDHRERFRIEAEAVARLRHPNIVQIYEFGEAEGSPFVTLELLEGGSLADRLKGTTQPGRAAAELVATLSLAMHAAHQAGIVHRDLKPANVLFDGAGTPKITDFGLAKRLEVDDGHTRTGQIMGTPSYMASEQAQGLTRQIGPPADIYALGAILYEMLTGRPPFKGASMMETLHQVVYDDVLPPSRIQLRLARDLETICLKCLEKEPPKRYGSAAELADDLHRYLDSRPIRARRTPLWERAAKWVRRRPAAATMIGLCSAGVLALIVAYVRYDAQVKARVAQEKAAALAEDRRVARERTQSEKILADAQTQLFARDWADGQLIRNLSTLVTRLKAEPRLTDILGRAEQMQQQAETGLQEDAESQRARERHHLFVQRLNAALFTHRLSDNSLLP
jgi:tRNA A-37 threonylcarbamoyl transferase component Bud32